VRLEIAFIATREPIDVKARVADPSDVNALCMVGIRPPSGRFVWLSVQSRHTDENPDRMRLWRDRALERPKGGEARPQDSRWFETPEVESLVCGRNPPHPDLTDSTACPG
jgi:hypothetical protein